MLRAALGLLFVLACSGCAASVSQTAAAPECRSPLLNPSSPDYQDCSNQTGNQLGVYVGGTVSYGMMRAVR